MGQCGDVEFTDGAADWSRSRKARGGYILGRWVLLSCHWWMPWERSMTKSRDQIAILIVDLQTLFRQGLQELLQVEEDLAVVAQAGTVDEAVASVTHTKPDVVLLDVELPGPDSATTLARIRRTSPDSQIIALSVHD